LINIGLLFNLFLEIFTFSALKYFKHKNFLLIENITTRKLLAREEKFAPRRKVPISIRSSEL
jgi:hypothetical protein